jgi:hypothetical protein
MTRSGGTFCQGLQHLSSLIRHTSGHRWPKNTASVEEDRATYWDRYMRAERLSVAKDLAADVGAGLDHNVLPRSVSRNIWRKIPPCRRLQSVPISHAGCELFA